MISFHRIKKDIGLQVLKSHNYQCSICSKTNNLCVHHIKRMKYDDSDYNNPENLTVICRNCHMSLHRKAGHIILPPPIVNKWGRRGKDNPPVVCKIVGCNKPQHGRALCKKHYEYYRRRRFVGI